MARQRRPRDATPGPPPFGPTLVVPDRHWPKIGRNRSNMVEIGTLVRRFRDRKADRGRILIWACVAPIRPASAPHFGQTRPGLGEIWPMSCLVGLTANADFTTGILKGQWISRIDFVCGSAGRACAHGRPSRLLDAPPAASTPSPPARRGSSATPRRRCGYCTASPGGRRRPGSAAAPRPNGGGRAPAARRGGRTPNRASTRGPRARQARAKRGPSSPPEPAAPPPNSRGG